MANNRAKNERNPKSCSKGIAWTRICGRWRRRRGRTNRYKNIKSPPVYRGDLTRLVLLMPWMHVSSGPYLISFIISPFHILLRLRLRQNVFNTNRCKWPYQVYTNFTNMQVTIYSWYIMNQRQVGRPPLRSYLTAGTEATRKGRTFTVMMEYIMQHCVNWITDARWSRVGQFTLNQISATIAIGIGTVIKL